jgi:hypothetical protein
MGAENVDDRQQGRAGPSEQDAQALVERLRAAPAEGILTEVLSTLLSTAQVKLGRRDARLFIDLCAVLVDHAKGFVSDDLRAQVDAALGQLRMDQVAAEREVAATARPEPDGEPGFDESRAVWNAMIDRRPLAVVRAAAVSDVSPTIAFARRHGLDLAIRGGGHNVAGNGTVDGGIVLDLGDLADVTVDEAQQAVRVQAGATLRHIDAATQPHGLVVPIGVVSGTGIAGLTLGGGVGWLTRMHGLSCDNLLEVELVTADGDTVVASQTENPDLFWALKGGGGNFGVVTAFTFRAYPLGPQVFAATSSTGWRSGEGVAGAGRVDP